VDRTTFRARERFGSQGRDVLFPRPRRVTAGAIERA
jgi:hypothetical protein